MNDDKFINTENIGTLKSGVVPRVSYCNLGVKKDGTPELPLTVGNKWGLPATELSHIPFSQAIEETQKIKEKHDKGTDGMIFPFVDSRMLYHKKEDMVENNITTGGVLFLDLDHFDYMDAVVEHFEDYVQLLPDLMSVVYSWSGNGLHIYFVTDPLTADQYAKSVVQHFVAFYLATKKILGDEAAAQMPVNGDKTVCDHSCASYTQREWLAYTPVIRWNEWATKVVYDKNTIKGINEILKEDAWQKLSRKQQKAYNAANRYVYGTVDTDCDWEVISTFDVNDPPLLHHLDRLQLFSNLRELYGQTEELKKQWERCANLMPEYDRHSTAEYLGFCDEWWDMVYEYRIDPDLLKSYGYNVDKKVRYNNASTLTGDLSKYRVIDVALEKDKYMWDYRGTFISNATTYNYIASPTNTGKTDFVKKLQEEGGKNGFVVDLCYPMISTRDGKGGENIITTADVKDDTLSKYQNTSMTFTFDTFVRIMDVCYTSNTPLRDYLFVDESHLIVTDVSYRTSTMIDLVNNVGKLYKHIFFMSGTTWREYEYLDHPTIFNVTKVQPVRTKMTIYNYANKEEVEKDEKGNDIVVKKTYDMALFWHILRNHNRGVNTIIYANRLNTKVKRMLDRLNINYKVTSGIYSRATKQSETVENINKTKSMKGKSVIKATKYMSVGVEIKDEGDYDFIFLDPHIPAQEIQQVKERAREGNITISLWHDLNEKKLEDLDVQKDLMTALINSMNDRVNTGNREAARNTFKCNKFKKIDGANKLYIKYDEHTDMYGFVTDIFERNMFYHQQLKEYSDIDFIVKYFNDKGIRIKGEDVDVTEFVFGNRSNHQKDSDYIIEHFDEIHAFIKRIDTFASINDYIREYDSTSEQEPKFEDGAYYFNNTNFVVGVLNILIYFSGKAEQLLSLFKENNVPISMSILSDYKTLEDILSYNETIGYIVRHVVSTMKHHPDLEEDDKKEIKEIIKGEMEFVANSKRIDFEKFEHKIIAKNVKNHIRNIIRTTIKQCIRYPEMLNVDNKEVLSFITIDDVFADLFTDKRDNTDKIVAITVDGAEYSSIKDACEKLGWNYETFKNIRSRHKNKKQFTYKGHTVVMNDELTK